MRKTGRWITSGLLAALVIMSCGKETGPPEPILANFGLAPSFSSEAAGIVDIASGLFLIYRIPPGGERVIVSDTIINFSPGDSAVSFELSVLVTNPADRFELTAALADMAGDTVFRAGPIEVEISTGSAGAAPPVLPLVFDYFGIGSDAGTVVIQSEPGFILGGDSILLIAEALDSSGVAIPGTPIQWVSLDPSIAFVRDDDIGWVIGGTQSGTARIIARLLTHQEDTISVDVMLPPSGLQVQSGNNQTAPPDSMLPQPIVARVTSSDGAGVPFVEVNFAVVTGGGSLSADTVFTDSNGDASVDWTLGSLVGSQSVVATSPALPGLTATFTATAQAGQAGGLSIVSGNNQIAPTGTAVPVAPTVRVTDQGGSAVSGTTVVFSVTAGGGTVTGDTVVTDANGDASVGSWTLGGVGIPQTLQASVTGLTPVSFGATSTNVDGAVAVMISGGNNQTAPVDSAVATAPSVLVTGPGGAPVAGASVVFAVSSGNGSVTGATAVTDSAGIATVGSWTMGQTAGSNTMTATAPSITPVTFTATGVAQTATQLVAVGGNAQVDTSGTVLPLALVVEAQDQFNNPVSGVSVSWFASDGSVNPTSGTTDAQGRTSTFWTLGSNELSPTVTAQAANLQSAVFTATTIFPNPTILMSLIGTNRIRVGDSADMLVRLTAPAGSSGVTVNISSDAPATISVGTPPTVNIASGDTTGTIKLTANSSGTTFVRANATGFAAGSLSVLASLQVLSTPVTLNVPFGGTASLPITLSAPAGAGGEVVNLTTTQPGNVGLVNSSVTVPAGQTTVNATVTGVAPGQSVVTASSVNFGSSQTTVSTTANLNVVQTTLAFAANFPAAATIRLESGGQQIAAPSPGIPVTMISRDSSCVVPASPVTIPTGLVDTVSTMSYGGSAQLSCTTYVVATATGITSDSVRVTVNPPPQLNLTSATPTGAGLSRAQSFSLGQTAPMITPVTLTVSDSSVALLAVNSTDTGAGSIVVNVPQNGSSRNYYLHGLEGVVDTVDIYATATGYVPDTISVPIEQPAIDIIFLGTNTTALSNDDPFQVRVGVPNSGLTFMSVEESVRPGGPGLTATITNSDGSVAQLVTTPVSGDTVTTTLTPGNSRSPGNVAQGGVAFDPMAAGTTQVNVTAPGYITLPGGSPQVIVTAPSMNLNSATVTGAGLQRSQSASLGAPAPAGTVVRLVSSDPSVLLLAPNSSTIGTDTLDIPLNTGVSSFSYYTHGLEGQVDTVMVTATAPGYTSAQTNIAVLQPAVDIIFLGTSTTSLTAPDPFQVRIGVSNSAQTFMSVEEGLRPGAPPLTATITNSDSLVAELITVAGSSQTVMVDIDSLNSRSPNNVASGGVALDPNGPGSTTVSVSIPGYISLTNATLNVNVTAPTVTLSNTTVVGSGLVRVQSGFLSAQAPDTTIMTLTSSDSTALLLSPDAATVGQPSIIDTLVPGQSGFNYYVHGLEGVVDTVDVIASIPGYVPDTVTQAIWQPAIDIIFLTTSLTTLTANDPFQARIGIPNAAGTFMSVEEQIRPGASPLTVTFTNSQSGVSQLVTTALSGQAVTANVALGQSRTPNLVANGGVEFEPLATGSTTVQVAAPGYITLPNGSQVVNVTAPAINMNTTTPVGSGLMRIQSGSLGAPAPAGTVLRIKSSNPSVALVSANATTVGTDSVDIPINTGASGFNYYVHGLEGQTGTVTITATAAGYTDGTVPVTVVPPAMDIIFLTTSTTSLSNPDPFQVRVGIPNGTNTTMSVEQAIRFGAPPQVFTVTSSDSTIGDLITLADSGGSVTVAMDSGQARTPNGVLNGGVEFRPMGPGVVSISISNANFVALPNATQNVTVTTPALTFGTMNDVGAGLQERHTVFLGAPAPAGLVVRIASQDSSVLLVSNSISTPATGFIDFAVNTGASSFNYYTAGVEGQTGAVDLIATAPAFTADTITTNVLQPAIEIVGLGTSKTTGSTDDAFYARVGTPNATQTGIARQQELRAGANPISVSFTNSDGTVSELVTTTSNSQSLNLNIVAQSATTPTSFNQGGVAFRVLGVGTSTVTASTPGYIQLPNASITVTVN